MSFSTKECAWAQTKIKLLGRTIIGIQSFEFGKEVDKEHLFAAGDEPIDIQTGNKKPTGSVTVLKYELDMLDDAAQAAGFAGIEDVPHDAIIITCAFKKNPASEMRVIDALGVAFTGKRYAMEQNAKSMPVPLPFLCMKIIARKGQV